MKGILWFESFGKKDQDVIIAIAKLHNFDKEDVAREYNKLLKNLNKKDEAL